MHRLRSALDEKAKPERGKASAEFATEAVEHYGRQLHGFLARRLHRPHEIDDLVQDTYVALLKARDTDLIVNPRAYVLRVAANVLYRFSKRDKFGRRFVEVDSDLVDFMAENPPDPAQDSLAERLSSQDQLNVALAKLPPLFQAVLLMRYSYGYSYGEISEKLQISCHKVERYLAQAKEALVAIDWEWN
jgi:RNA polymerase sigma factor (sigma-70 family)